MRYLLAALLSVIACPDGFAGESITVAAAISLKEPLRQIVEAYQSRTGQRVRIHFGSSGQLMAQVKTGAPIDVFISAADEQVEDLARAKRIDPASRRVVAGNRLVLIAPADSVLPLADFTELDSDSIRRLAIGEPKTVPAGMYAQQALRSLGIDGALRDRLVYGSNVRQVLDYVARGEVSAGIVYRTDVAAHAGKPVKVLAAADPALHDPIEYTAATVVASGRENTDASRALIEFLLSDPAQSILADHGFVTSRDAGADAAATQPAAEKP